MKTKFLVCVLIVIFTQQTFCIEKYYKFAEKDAVWNSITTRSYGYPNVIETVYLLGDSVRINGLKYFEVLMGRDSWNTTKMGAVREDSISRKIYYRNWDTEIVLYDFSLKTGDTIFYSGILLTPTIDNYKVVDSIKTMEINSELRKVWYLKNPVTHLPDMWVEGIGSIYSEGLLYPLITAIPTNGSSTYFGCFKYGNTSYFNRYVTTSESCPCGQWLVNAPQIKVEAIDFVLSPIPARGFINIKANKSFGNAFVELYNSEGEKVVFKKIDQNECQLSCSELTDGIYFYRVIGIEKVYQTGKILVKK